MTLKQQADKALETIQADEQLLRWARGSIRYNDGPISQASDFIAKLKLHGIDEPALTNKNAVGLALAALELLDTRGEKSDDLPPDPEGMNDSRANYAQTALDAFAAVTNMDSAGEDAESIFGDLLCDLRHWCDRNGVDFEQKVLMSEINYNEETKDETA